MGPHSYDPGISRSGMFWVTRIPEGSIEIDLDNGEASLRLNNLCIFDTFTVPNSLTPNHPSGLVGAVINSLHIRWSNVSRSIPGFSDPGRKFRGDFLETSATIEVMATTPPATGHGFTFVSDPPATTQTLFAQIGHERNGVAF